MSLGIREIIDSIFGVLRPSSQAHRPLGVEDGGLGLRNHLILAVVGALMLVSRRPDAVLNPHFWAEDGKVWFLEAYQLGWFDALLQPHSGYYQTLPRLTAALAQLLPLGHVPLLFSLVAIGLSVLPVNLLATSRFASVVPSLPTRLAMGFVYLGLPNSSEIHANLTNAQWHLAVLACMVVLAQPSRVPAWRAADALVLTLAALSGPFALPLLAIACLSWWMRSERRPSTAVIILAAGAIIQGAAMLGMQDTRSPAPLGATPKLFAEIVGMQVVLGGLLGERGYAYLINHVTANWLPVALIEDARRSAAHLIAFFLWASTAIYTLCRSPWQVRLFVLFCLAVLGGAMATPVVIMSEAQWPHMMLPGIGSRYWALPALGFLVALHATATAASHRFVRTAALAVLYLVPIGIALDWAYEPREDLGFRDRAAAFEIAPPNTSMVIPVHPGEDWYMTLIKK